MMGAGKTGLEGFENTQGGQNTIHGDQRLKERGFTPEDVAVTKQTTTIKTQTDGARVYIKEITPGRFNVIVEGANGVITAFKNIRQGALDRLTRNYGWREIDE